MKGNLFSSRLELVQYVISRLTEKSMDECGNQAMMYENVPFRIKISCD